MLDRIKIKEIIDQKSPLNDFFSLLFKVDGGNEYKLFFENVNNTIRIQSGITLTSGETEKTLLKQLEKYDSSNDEKKCKEINDILDEWEEVVENLEAIEKMIHNYITEHSTRM